MSRLLRRTGHLLCGHAERRRPRLSATFIDTYAKVGFAKLYDRKTPITAADLLNDRVSHFYEENGVALQRILTDQARNIVAIPSIPNTNSIPPSRISTTKAKGPQTNGIVERYHKTMLNEGMTIFA